MTSETEALITPTESVAHFIDFPAEFQDGHFANIKQIRVTKNQSTLSHYE